MKKIKVGVAGLGFIGPAHIEAIRRIPNTEVVAVCHTDQASAETKARQLGIDQAFGDYEAFIRQDFEVVHICTPNHLHYSMTKTALLAGKHVVCEKPLATARAEAEELLALAQQQKLIHALHFNIRYYPLVRQMKMMRENGDLGKVYSIIGSYLQDWLFYETDYNWRLETEKSGDSRAIADIGSHLLDLIEYVSGLKISAVMADFNTIHSHRKKPLKAIETYSGKLLEASDYQDVPIHTEDFASVLLRFSDGTKGNITVSQVSAGRKNRLHVEISGSKSTLGWDSEKPNEMWVGKREQANQLLMKDPALCYPDTAKIISFPGGHNEGFPDTSKQLFQEVYQAIRENKFENLTFPNFADGLREQILGDKIVESHHKQAWVKVE
jgi:predicted dehydrogenase